MICIDYLCVQKWWLEFCWVDFFENEVDVFDVVFISENVIDVGDVFVVCEFVGKFFDQFKFDDCFVIQFFDFEQKMFVEICEFIGWNIIFIKVCVFCVCCKFMKFFEQFK